MSHVFDAVTPPVPDPDLKPKPADEMAEEGDREGPVLTDGTQADDGETEADPPFTPNGD